jgi:hypothetical protein
MMKISIVVAVASVVTLTAGVGIAAGAGSASPSGRASDLVSHVVKATEHGRGMRASLAINAPFAAGSKLVKVEYHLHDGYTKRVLIPGGAFVVAEDIAICGVKGMRYPDIGFVGTGLPCTPELHKTEVFYNQHVGDLAGRIRPPHAALRIEKSHGSGRYLTVGHIDHGALMSVEYYWANDEHLTVLLRGDALVDHTTLMTRPGKLSARVTRHT